MNGGFFMRFVKMQNCGNDFIFLFQRPTEAQVIKLCNRNFGIGADGVVYLYQKGNKQGIEIYNADGSSALFCGSALLCAGLYLYKESGIKELKVETPSGDKEIFIDAKKGVKVRVEVGKPNFQASNTKENRFNRLLFLKDERGVFRVRASEVNVGNSHLVIRGLYDLPTRERIVNAIKNHELFSGGINVEFCERGHNKAKVIVYERGCGKTLCCTSGGGAVFALLNKMGHFKNEGKIVYEGGIILFKKVKNKIYAEGKPKVIFVGAW